MNLMDKNYSKSPKYYSNIPLIYLFIYKRLRENFKFNQQITYKYLIYRINLVVNGIPRKYHDIIIKELIDYGLINKLNESKRSPLYELNSENHEKLIKELEDIEQSGLRYKILKDKYEKVLKEIEGKERTSQKYNILKCDYEKFLRKLELKKLDESHYW